MKTYFYSSKFIFTMSFSSITRVFHVFFYENTICHSTASYNYIAVENKLPLFLIVRYFKFCIQVGLRVRNYTCIKVERSSNDKIPCSDRLG